MRDSIGFPNGIISGRNLLFYCTLTSTIFKYTKPEASVNGEVAVQSFIMRSTEFTQQLLTDVCMYVKHRKSMDQPGMAANPVRGQLIIENVSCVFSPCARSCLRIWSRETYSAVVPLHVSPLILYIEIEYCAYLPEFSRFPRRCPFIYMANRHRVSPCYSSSGHAIAYRWRSLPKV